MTSNLANRDNSNNLNSDKLVVIQSKVEVELLKIIKETLVFNNTKFI